MKVQIENTETEEVRSEATLEGYVRSGDMLRKGDSVDNYNLRCRELLSKLGRVLRLMKLTGTYYGDTSLDKDLQADSSRFYLGFYCGIVLLGQWILTVQAATSLFYEGFSHMPNFYLLLIYGVWYLECAVVTTINLVILPKRHKRPSRFARFIGNLLKTENDFSGITMQSVNRLLALACSFALFNSVCIVILDAYGNISVTKFHPWNGSIQYRFLHLLFGMTASCSWSIPFVLFCVSSALLAGMFKNLEKRVLSDIPESLNIESLRQEHLKLCEIVALADEVFSPFLFATVTFEIPLICINFHQLVNSPSSRVTFILSVSYWCVSIATKLAIIMKFGVRVNEKVRQYVKN